MSGSGDMMSLLGEATLATQEAAAKFDTERGKITPALASMDAKKAELDTWAAAAAADLPSHMFNRVYLHQDGDDANDGLSADSPVKTLKRACQLGPRMGALFIELLPGAEILADASVIWVQSTFLFIKGTGSSKPKIIQNPRVTASGELDVRLFMAQQNQPVSLGLYNVELILARQADNPSNLTVLYHNGVLTQSGVYVGSISIGMQGCLVGTSDGTAPLGNLLSPSSGAHSSISAVSSVFGPEMYGHLVRGVAAGTDPAATSNVLSNLPSL